MVNKQKSVLIADCSYGFARTAALFLNQKGWKVYAAMWPKTERKILQDKGIYCIDIDFSSSDSVKSVSEEILKISGNDLDGIVIYTGYTQIGAVEDITRDGLQKQFENTVFGPIELVSFIIPSMCEKGSGNIIFVNTLNSRFTFPFMGSYGSARRALESFYDATRRELQGTGIQVFCIVPYCLKQDNDEHAQIITKNDKGYSKFSNLYSKIAILIDEILNYKSTDKLMLKAVTEVYNCLENKNSSRRIVIGLNSKIRDAMHKLLPNKFLDFIVKTKMKYIYKIT